MSSLLGIFNAVVSAVVKLKDVFMGLFIYKAGKDKARQEGLEQNVKRIKEEIKVDGDVDRLSTDDVFKRLSDKFSRSSRTSNDND